MSERLLARYRLLRSSLRMPASRALDEARLYCSFTDEEHEQIERSLDSHIEQHCGDDGACCVGWPDCDPVASRLMVVSGRSETWDGWQRQVDGVWQDCDVSGERRDGSPWPTGSAFGGMRFMVAVERPEDASNFKVGMSIERKEDR